MILHARRERGTMPMRGFSKTVEELSTVKEIKLRVALPGLKAV